MNYKKIVLLTPLLLLFSGCVEIIKPLPPIKTYSLSIDDSKNLSNIYIDKSIKIYAPIVQASLDDRNILYSRDKISLQGYELAKWRDKPSKMLQELMIDKLNSSKNFKFVSSQKVRVPTNYTLQSEVVHFKQLMENDESYALFKIRVYLKNSTSKIFKAKQFTYKLKTKMSNSSSSALFLNKAVNKYLVDLNLWLLKNINK